MGTKPTNPAASDVVVRPARPQETVALSALARRSKAHWGYDADFMERCENELTVNVEDMARHDILVAETAAGLVGYGCLARRGDAAGEIWNMFVDPAAIGSGVGRALMQALIEQARQLGLTRLFLDADPHARGFYERLGFVYERDVPSGSIPGRTLPRLARNL